MLTFSYGRPFPLEKGGELPDVTIAYHTYGSLNLHKNNVIWVCHALTGNSDAADWWPGMIGDGCIFDTSKYYVVCANIIGSHYGSTGPLSINTATGKPFYHDFPFITIRDMVQAHILLRQHLGIEKIALLAGGSMGGYQALEWALMEPGTIEKLFLIATSPAESAWGIAIHATQRLAIEADATWQHATNHAGWKGLKTARAIGLLSYRNYDLLVAKQSDTDPEKTDDFRASSYINYQGSKLVRRFNAFSYWMLTKAMDSHNIARGRGGNINATLAGIHQPTFIMGIGSDILCPVAEQLHMAQYIPNSQYCQIDSPYGHDGFIVETPTITKELGHWLADHQAI